MKYFSTYQKHLNFIILMPKYCMNKIESWIILMPKYCMNRNTIIEKLIFIFCLSRKFRNGNVPTLSWSTKFTHCQKNWKIWVKSGMNTRQNVRVLWLCRRRKENTRNGAMKNRHQGAVKTLLQNQSSRPLLHLLLPLFLLWSVRMVLPGTLLRLFNSPNWSHELFH